MKEVYLDHAAATPIRPEVTKVMQPFLGEYFGNPNSLHRFGQKTQAAISQARGQVASLIGANDLEEIIFTSSGSEANNLAVKGLTLAQKKKGSHLIVSNIEHFSVLHSAKSLEKLGFKVTYLPVDKYGLVNPKDLQEAITDETILVSIMHANNEIGTIEPISELASIAKEKGVSFHTDAVAAVGTIPVDVSKLDADALSLAANQFYGPPGAAALYVKKGTRIIPLINGGIQEEGKRAGTENTPAIVGLGKAAEIAVQELPQRIHHLKPLRDALIKGLLKKIKHCELTGHPEKRLPGHVSVVVKFIEGESMLMFMDMAGIAAASGSACTSKALKASHVLTAIGLAHEVAHGSLVFTLGKDSTKQGVEYVLKTLPPIVDRLRAMSPLYQKYLEGGGK